MSIRKLDKRQRIQIVLAMQCMLFQMRRVERKEIVGSTVQNYLKALDCFVKWWILTFIGKKSLEIFLKERAMQMMGFLLMTSVKNCYIIRTGELNL